MNDIIKISEKIRDHLTQQKKQSITRDGSICAYRGKDNTMCAVGCLITDEAYQKEIECLPCNRQEVTLALEKSGISVDENVINVLKLWQTYHDSDYCYEKWCKGNFWSQDSCSPEEQHKRIMSSLT